MKARCSYLDRDGKQCSRVATTTRAIHLESEMYSFIRDPDFPETDVRDLATWLAAPLCKPHGEAFGGVEVKRGRAQ